LTTVTSYEAGVSGVLDRSADVFFADRAILVDAAQSSSSADELLVVERLFTHEPIALALGRDDDDFRLVVDRALSKLYTSPEFETIYLKWFGEPDDATTSFFRMNALPE
jgi:ABC-type amino acid transport substrate-binding protein